MRRKRKAKQVDPVREKAKLVVACALPVIAGFIAVPRMFDKPKGENDDDGPIPESSLAPAGQVPEPAAGSYVYGDANRKYAPRRETPSELEESEEPAVKPTVAVDPGGDLEVGLKLRWQTFETGESVTAKVRLENHTQRDVHVPAAGEPNAGLAIVVRNSEGAEVRRVVEAARDQPLPRRTLRLASGFDVELAVTVIAQGEEPLPPGDYTALVEMRADPVLGRLGLPVWTAPNGAIHSAPIAFAVTAKGE